MKERKRVAIVAIGTRGDVQPFVALGSGLQAAGHLVSIATDATFATLIRGRGLSHYPIAGDVRGVIRSTAGRASLVRNDSIVDYGRQLVQMAEPVLRAGVSDCWRACREADVIVASQLGIGFAYHIAEKLKIPLFRAYYAPVSPTCEHPAAFVPRWLHLGKYANLWSHHASRQLVWHVMRHAMNTIRHDVLQLSPIGLREPFGEMDKRQWPLLYAYSPLVWERPRDWGDWIHITGYWFLDHPADWQPSPGLLDFLDAGSPPVFVGFGSMCSQEPEAMANLVLQALRRAGRRGVLQMGWGGMSPTGFSDDAYVVDEIPHDWLFPRTAAVIHHGGAGTTAAALRAGVPSVVTPFLPDQRFWGQRVHELGAGAQPIPRRQLTVENLAAAIKTAAGDERMRQRAEELGRAIRAENGVGTAVAAFDAYLLAAFSGAKRLGYARHACSKSKEPGE